MKWKITSATVRGSAHQRSGLPNQDAVDSGLETRESEATVLAVADGHGAARYFRSQVGSTLAVHVAVHLLREFLRPGTELETPEQLAQELVRMWRSAVQSDLMHNPFTEDDLNRLDQEPNGARQELETNPEYAYGATLLAVGTAADRMICLQLGDGDILTVDAAGQTTRPMAADDRLVGNQTTSLCQPNAPEEVRFTFLDGAARMPIMVLLSTDGYVNSFRSEEDFLQIGHDYLAMLREHGSEMLEEELPKILAEATQQGSGDDITLGLLYRHVLPGSAGAAVAAAADPPSTPPGTKSLLIRDLQKEKEAGQRRLDELSQKYEGAQQHLRWLRLLAGGLVLAVVVWLSQPVWRAWFQPHPPAPAKDPAAPVVAPMPGSGDGKRPKAERPAVGTGNPTAPRQHDREPGLPVVSPETGPAPVDKPAEEKPAPAASPSVNPSAAPESKPADPAVTTWVLSLDDGRSIPIAPGTTIKASQVVPGAKGVLGKVRREDSILKLANLSGQVWTVTEPGKHAASQFHPEDSVPLHANTRIILPHDVSLTVLGVPATGLKGRPR